MITLPIILAVLGCVVQGFFIAVEHKKKYVPAVCLKGIASLIFVAIGYIGFLAAGDRTFARMVFLGLIFGALGDILLNLRFVVKEKASQPVFLTGVAAFLTGHILYLVALIPQATHVWISLLAGVVIAACILAVIFKSMELKPAFKAFGILYIGAVVLMTAVAFGNLIAEPTGSRLMYAIGALLFTVSDIVMIFNTFGKETKFSLRITNLSLYYVGQLLIAFSLFLA